MDAANTHGDTTTTPALAPADPAGAATVLRAAVDAELGAFLAAKRTTLGAMAAELLPVADELAALCADGPRLRPAFAYWGWRAFGGPAGEADGDTVLRAVAALELLAVGARVHDVVLTPADATTRSRSTKWSRSTTRSRFAARHDGAGLAGAGSDFGRGAAILVGDLAFVWSDELLQRAGLGLPALGRIAPDWDRMRTEMTAARYLHLLRAVGGLRAEDGSPAGVPSGPGTVSLAHRPLRLGAALAGAAPGSDAVCAGIGQPLDEAAELAAGSADPSGVADRIAVLTGQARQAIAAAPLAADVRAALDALAVATAPG